MSIDDVDGEIFMMVDVFVWEVVGDEVIVVGIWEFMGEIF